MQWDCIIKFIVLLTHEVCWPCWEIANNLFTCVGCHEKLVGFEAKDHGGAIVLSSAPGSVSSPPPP